jgi:ribosomal protein S18 acetylase RimI-like enzyme
LNPGLDDTTLPPLVGRVALRRETEDDEAFRFTLFRASRGPGWDQLVLPADMLTAILRQQFQAQTLGYRSAHPDADLDIITVDGAPAGRLAVDRRAGVIHLIDIAVTPEMRGQGVGTAVLRRLTDEADSRAQPLSLQVANDNPAAQRLYLRLGFTLASRGETHLEMIRRPGSAVA